MQYGSYEVTVANKATSEYAILMHHSLSILASHDPKDLPNCRVQRETLVKNAVRSEKDKEINYMVHLVDSHNAALSLDNNTYNIKSYHHEVSYQASVDSLDSMRKELKCGMFHKVKKSVLFPAADPDEIVYLTHNYGFVVSPIGEANFQFLRSCYMDYIGHTVLKKSAVPSQSASSKSNNTCVNSNNDHIGSASLLPRLYFIVRLQQKCPIRKINSKKCFVVMSLAFPLYKQRIDGIMLFKNGNMKQTSDSKMRYRKNDVSISSSSSGGSSGGGLSPSSSKVGGSGRGSVKTDAVELLFGDISPQNLNYIDYGSSDCISLNFANPDKAILLKQLEEDIAFLESVKIQKDYSMSIISCKMGEASRAKALERQEEMEEIPIMRRKTVDAFHDSDVSIGPVGNPIVTSNATTKTTPPSYYNTDYEYYINFDNLFVSLVEGNKLKKTLGTMTNVMSSTVGKMTSIFNADKRTYGEKLLACVDDVMTGYP